MCKRMNFSNNRTPRLMISKIPFDTILLLFLFFSFLRGLRGRAVNAISLSRFQYAIFFLFVLINCTDLCLSQSISNEPKKPILTIKNGLFAINNVNLIPMTSNAVIKSQTVLIKNRQVENIFDTGSIKVAKEYQIIDGTGYYLMPGLADMHTHIREPNDLHLNIYNGVTTVLDMGGSSKILEMRSQVQKGELIGPQIFASVFVDGTDRTFWKADGSEPATKAVKGFKQQGWDFIKVYNSVSRKSFSSLIEEGNKQNIAIIGHGVREVGMENGLKAGQKMIAHAEEYIYAYFGKDLDESLIPKIVNITKDSGAYLTANLSTYEIVNKQWGNRYLKFRKKTFESTRNQISEQKDY